MAAESRSPGRKRTIGSLSHAAFGATVRVLGASGCPQGMLWGVQHVAAFGDIRQPWTRLTLFLGHGSEGTRGLPPETPVIVTPATDGKTEGN